MTEKIRITAGITGIIVFATVFAVILRLIFM